MTTMLKTALSAKIDELNPSFKPIDVVIAVTNELCELGMPPELTISAVFIFFVFFSSISILMNCAMAQEHIDDHKTLLLRSSPSISTDT